LAQANRYTLTSDLRLLFSGLRRFRRSIMRHGKARFLIGKFAMYTMPRLFPLSKKWLAPVSVFVLLLLVSLMSVDAGAQKKKRPATTAKPQQTAGANTNTQTAQAKPQKKNITPLRSGETSEGSRITITSDAPLNDYSAYRNGDRYYVVIPEANAPRAQSGLRGRGFEDVQVQKRGNDAVLSFKLQPGTNARVSQRFNRLDVELTAPGGKTAAQPTATPKTATPPTVTPTPQTNPRPTPQTATNGQQNPSVTGNTNPQINSGATNPTLTPPVAGGNPAVVYPPTPDANASPGVNPETSPVATPPSDQVAQAQQPTQTQPATTTSTTSSSANSTTFGTMLRQNWLVVLIAALVLLSLVMIVAARSRAQRGSAAATPARRASRKERRAAAKREAAELEEADKAVPVADVLYKSSTLPKAKPLATEAAEAKAALILEEDETKEVEVAPSVDTERVESEVKNVLAGESYDEAVIGATDAGTRQLIATELLSALAGRNVERRERAREAFVKHDYLDEATRQLRTADAPAERAAAARSLGYVQDKSTTPHLVAALEDSEPEVRRAAVESLAELRDPSALQPLKDLLNRERDKKVSRSLIKRAIQASRAAETETQTPTASTAPALETETVTLETEAPAVEAAEQPAALADLSVADVAPGLVGVAASSLVTAEVDTEAEEAARREAEAEEARQRAEEERLRVEAERKAEEEARLAVQAKAEEERRQAEEAARLQAQEEERARAEEEERLRLEAEARQREEEEAARLRAAEQERQRIEEERKRAEEEARQQAEAEARARAEEEARQQAAEAARLKAEEEARLAAAEAERQAQEEAARLRAEEAERQQRAREEEERRQAEEAARLKAEAEARQLAEAEAARKQAEEEAARRAEEERQAEAERARLAEEARLRAEAEAARQRAEEEARQREEEEARLAAEAEAQARAEEAAARRKVAEEEAAAMLNAEAISPVEHEASTLVQPAEPFIERNDGTASGWVDVDISHQEILSHTEPVSPAEETATQESLTFEPVAETVEARAQESKEIEPAGFSIIGETTAQPSSKEIDYAVTERGIAEFDEYSSVPGGILKRLSSEEPTERAAAVADLSRVGGDDSFRQINAAFDDPSVEVRNAAARSLFNLNADRAATFTRALRESPPERRRKIGSALASSGLASEAIGQLMGESREKTYDAFSLLFLMSKAGEVQPLMRAIEEHPNNEVRLAVVKLLALSGQQEILPAFRRLAVRGSLPTEVRSAVMEAIYQISSQSPTAA
jgi:hypothetical protein